MSHAGSSIEGDKISNPCMVENMHQRTKNIPSSHLHRRMDNRRPVDYIDKFAALVQNPLYQFFLHLWTANRTDKAILRLRYIGYHISQHGSRKFFILLCRQLHIPVQKALDIPICAIADGLMRMPKNFTGKAADSDDK